MASAEDIARLWAEQAPKGPKVAGNFWREDRECGHYRSCIARIVEGASGKLVALIWESHWGTGTAMMINLCESHAKKAGLKAFRVPSIEKAPTHEKNLAYFDSLIADCEAKIARARTVDWKAEANRYRKIKRAYKKTFGIK